MQVGVSDAGCIAVDKTKTFLFSGRLLGNRRDHEQKGRYGFKVMRNIISMNKNKAECEDRVTTVLLLSRINEGALCTSIEESSG